MSGVGGAIVTPTCSQVGLVHSVDGNETLSSVLEPCHASVGFARRAFSTSLDLVLVDALGLRDRPPAILKPSGEGCQRLDRQHRYERGAPRRNGRASRSPSLCGGRAALDRERLCRTVDTPSCHWEDGECLACLLSGQLRSVPARRAAAAHQAMTATQPLACARHKRQASPCGLRFARSKRSVMRLLIVQANAAVPQHKATAANHRRIRKARRCDEQDPAIDNAVDDEPLALSLSAHGGQPMVLGRAQVARAARVTVCIPAIGR